jgi:large subunit ribosomal protein L10
MNRTEKESFVAEFRDRVQRAGAMYLTDFTGLDVKSMTALRRRVKEAGGEYLVVKNRLALLALEDLDLPDISEHLIGPTGVAFGYDEPVGMAKALADYQKEHKDRPAFKIGVVENAVLAPSEIDRLAKLPPKEQLLAELAGAMQATLAAFVGVLQAKLQEMAGLLEALRQEREG